jgi:hypothetical protein
MMQGMGLSYLGQKAGQEEQFQRLIVWPSSAPIKAFPHSLDLVCNWVGAARKPFLCEARTACDQHTPSSIFQQLPRFQRVK